MPVILQVLSVFFGCRKDVILDVLFTTHQFPHTSYGSFVWFSKHPLISMLKVSTHETWDTTATEIRPKTHQKMGWTFFFQAVKSSQTTRPLQMYLEKIFWISGLTMEEHATSVQSTQTSFSNLNFTGKVQLVLKVMFSVWSEIWVGRKTYWFNFMSLLFKKGSLYRNKKGS